MELFDGEPVATAEESIGGGVAGRYNMSTTMEFRRRGIGSAMTLGALPVRRLVRGVLQAAEPGVGVYR